MSQAMPNHTCPLCGQPNECAAAASGRHDVDCWCAKVTFNPASLERIPEAWRHKACLCRACATQPPARHEPA